MNQPTMNSKLFEGNWFKKKPLPRLSLRTGEKTGPYELPFLFNHTLPLTVQNIGYSIAIGFIEKQRSPIIRQRNEIVDIFERYKDISPRRALSDNWSLSILNNSHCGGHTRPRAPRNHKMNDNEREKRSPLVVSICPSAVDCLIFLRTIESINAPLGPAPFPATNLYFPRFFFFFPAVMLASLARPQCYRRFYYTPSKLLFLEGDFLFSAASNAAPTGMSTGDSNLKYNCVPWLSGGLATAYWPVKDKQILCSTFLEK